MLNYIFVIFSCGVLGIWYDFFRVLVFVFEMGARFLCIEDYCRDGVKLYIWNVYCGVGFIVFIYFLVVIVNNNIFLGKVAEF